MSRAKLEKHGNYSYQRPESFLQPSCYRPNISLPDLLTIHTGDRDNLDPCPQHYNFIELEQFCFPTWARRYFDGFLQRQVNDHITGDTGQNPGREGWTDQDLFFYKQNAGMTPFL